MEVGRQIHGSIAQESPCPLEELIMTQSLSFRTASLLLLLKLTTTSSFTPINHVHHGNRRSNQQQRVRAPDAPFPFTSAESSSSLAIAPISLPPVNSENPNVNQINSVKDYFMPTSSEEATRRALEQYAQNKQKTSGEMVKSSDLIQIDTAMPGVKGSTPISRTTAFLPTPTYNKEISKKEVLWISQQFDIYMRKIPQAVFLYALLDFFVLPTSKAVMSDELEDDRMGVVKEFAGRAVFRAGVFSSIVAATIVFENVFYHPI